MTSNGYMDFSLQSLSHDRENLSELDLTKYLNPYKTKSSASLANIKKYQEIPCMSLSNSRFYRFLVKTGALCFSSILKALSTMLYALLWQPCQHMLPHTYTIHTHTLTHTTHTTMSTHTATHIYHTHIRHTHRT